MADPTNVQRGARTERQLAHINPAKAGERHAERLISKFAQKMGLQEGSAETLGALAGPFAAQLAGHFADIFAKKGGVPTQELSKAFQKLGQLHAVDEFVVKPPATVTHQNGLLDSRTFSIKDLPVRGQHKAEGSIAKSGHAVGMVFDTLGLDLHNFNGDIANILDMAGNAKKNLGDKDSWITIVGQMAMAAFGQPGDAKTRFAAALGAGIDGVKTAAVTPSDKMEVIETTAKVVGTESGTVTGLKNHAPRTANTGSTSGAFAVRAALLSGLKSQDDKVERTAGKVLGDVLRHLGVEPDKATKRKLHVMLKGLMADKSSSTGKTDVACLMDRVLKKLAEKDPKNGDLAALNELVQEAVAQNPDYVANEGIQQAFGTMASDSIAALVANEIGMKPPKDGKLTDKLFRSLEELLPSAPETTVNGEATAEVPHSKTPPDISKWDCDRPDIPQEFKDQALNVLKSAEFPMEHPRAQAMTHALAEVLRASLDPQTGNIAEADFAVGLQAWLVENGGASREVFEGIYHNLGQAMGAHAKTAQVLEAKMARYSELQGQQIDSTQSKSTVPLEKELEGLQRDIAMLQGNLRSGEENLKGHIAMLQRDGLNRMRMMVAEDKAPGDGVGAAAHGAAGAGGVGGGGGNVPPTGNGGVPPGGVPPGGKRNGLFDREGPSNLGILPGFNTGLRPEDDYSSKNLTVQQQRAIKCGEILADPALTIEDKIFLFMMWFTAFTDQEREQKLEELVQMDRETARNQKFTDELKSELKSLGGARETDENKLVQAQAKVDRLEQLGGNPQDLQAAKAEVTQCQSHLAERDAKIRGVEHELSDMQVKNDKAPKSREVLFMEIERLNQLRDKIMNMARSIMENSNRAIEKIFR